MDLIREYAGFILPDLSIQKCERQRIGSITTRISNERDFRDLGNKNYVLTGNYNENQMAMDTIMLSSKLLEDALVKDDKYSFHSSAISDGKDVIAIGGSSASGKTTTAISACLDSPDKIKIYSGDRTVIKDSKALAGSKKFHIRLGSVAYEIPKLKEFIPEYKTDSPWDTAKVISPETIKINSDYGERNIKCFVYPRKGSHKAEVSRIKDNRAILRLHEDMCHFADVYPTIILGQRKPMMDTEITHKNRQERIDCVVSLAKKVPILTVNGQLEDIAECVTGLMLDDGTYEKYCGNNE